MKGVLSYCPNEQKIIVSKNVKLLEEEYLMNRVTKSKHILQKLSNRIMNNETLEQTSQTIIDIPLHPHGRKISIRK